MKQMEKNNVFLHSGLFKYAQINSDTVDLDLVMLPSYVVTILVTSPRKRTK